MLKSRVILSCLLLMFLIFSATARADGSDKNDWLRVEVHGLNKALTNNVFAHLGPLPDSDVQRRAYLFNVSDNVTAALQSLGYFHGKNEQKVTRDGDGPWLLNIQVTPGPAVHIRYVDIRVDGEMRNDPAFNQWLVSVNMRPGDVLDQGTYEEVKSQLLSLALAQGYFDGKYITSRITVNRDINSATITLHFSSGQRYHIGRVSFDGSKLAPEFLQRLIPFQPDAPYSTGKLSALNSALIETGYFANIKVIPEIEAIRNDKVPVRVQLTPKPHDTIDLGFGVDLGNTADNNFQPRVSLTWRTPRLNRWGHSQETSIEWSRQRPKFLTTYTIPLSHPLDDKLQIKLGLLRDKYGVTQIYDAKARDFTNTGQLESTKGLVEIIRQQKLHSNWLLGYSIQALQESYKQSGTEYDPQFVLFGVGLQKTVRGDNTLDPMSGYRTSYSVEYGDPNLGSATQLIKLQARYLWVDTFFKKHRFVTRLDLGINIASDSDLAKIPPSLRYFAGGDSSIRGYSYQELGPYLDTKTGDDVLREVVGGRYLAVGSIEYQYYITPTWRIAAFVDAGNAYDKGQFKPVIAVGPGLHWLSPVGPIKLDVGFGLNKTDTQNRQWRIHLTMGSVL